MSKKIDDLRKKWGIDPEHKDIEDIRETGFEDISGKGVSFSIKSPNDAEEFLREMIDDSFNDWPKEIAKMIGAPSHDSKEVLDLLAKATPNNVEGLFEEMGKDKALADLCLKMALSVLASADGLEAIPHIRPKLVLMMGTAILHYKNLEKLRKEHGHG